MPRRRERPRKGNGAAAERRGAIVLGAGAAGLAAARTLADAGVDVVVLEARARLGGRILTEHLAGWPVPIEFGAEFVHGQPQATFAAARRAALAIVELPDVHARVTTSARWQRLAGFWQRLAAERRRIRLRGDVAFAAWLEQQRLPRARRQLLLDFVQGYHGADGRDVSARWLAANDEEVTAENRQFRPAAGYDGLVRALAAGVDVRLCHVVHTVEWRAGAVRVDGDATPRSFHARVAIVTVPLGVLQAAPGSEGAIRFAPSLAEKRRALSLLAPGQVARLVLRWRHAFWDDAFRRCLPALAGAPSRPNFVHAPGRSWPTWWTAAPLEVPMLTAWAGGPAAAALLDATPAVRLARAVGDLGEILRLPRRRVERELVGWHEHDWRADPFSRGAYSYARVGGAAAAAALARPLARTLFFAGEATSHEQSATVAGALESGVRAAREALAVLGRDRER